MKSKIALFLVFMMFLNMTACGGNSEPESAKSDLKAVVREAETPGMQAGNEATAIALKQYVYSRLLTEQLATEDFTQISETERQAKINELVDAWEKVVEFTTIAEKLTHQAILELGNATSRPVSGKNPFSFLAVAYAADDDKEFDQVAWAEKLTKQYDSLKGAQRYNQLAKQLGVDAKTAYEQMSVAQKIIHEGAMADADWNNKVVNILQATKTTAKVAVFGLSLVATGGASVSVMEGAGFIASGIECAIEIADTSSTIILGEKNKVSVGFNELKKKTAPLTAVVGLLNFDLANLQEKAKGTGDALVYISDSLMDLYFENKVLGMEISTSTDGKVAINAQAIDVTGLGVEDLKSTLESAGYPLPEGSMKILDLIRDTWDSDIEVMQARMDILTKTLSEQVPEEQSFTALGGIFGTYSSVITGADEEPESEIITLRDNGDGTVTWITDDGEETILNYDAKRQELYYESDGLSIEIQLSVKLGKVVGTGRMYGILWGSPIDFGIDIIKTM